MYQVIRHNALTGKDDVAFPGPYTEKTAVSVALRLTFGCDDRNVTYLAKRIEG